MTNIAAGSFGSLAAQWGLLLPPAHPWPDYPTSFGFRIPIGDFSLQLDVRLRAALDLLPRTSRLYVWRKVSPNASRDQELAEVFRAVGVTLDEPVSISLWTPAERGVLFSLCYLTNRWGVIADNLYILAEDRPDRYACFHGAQETASATFARKSDHDEAVEWLRHKNIPAYGEHIPNPHRPPPYPGIVGANGKLIPVDPRTGKPLLDGE